MHRRLSTILSALVLGLVALQPDVRAGGSFTPLPAPTLTLTFADPAFAPLPGARALFGRYEGGTYRIEVPADWNGRLVLYDHGYQGGSSPNAPFPGTASAVPAASVVSLRQHLVESGYAWASTSYRSTRWIPGLAALDTIALLELFARQVGTPTHTYLYGTSMGGNVVALLMEHFGAVFDGAVTECGVTAGIELLDFFTSYGAVAEYLIGADLTSLPPRDYFETRFLPALGRPGELTATGKQFQNVMINLTGGRRPFDTEGFAQSYSFVLVAVLQDLNNDAPFHSADVSPLTAAAGNVGVRYHIDAGLGLTDAELNAGVRRKAADPILRSATGPYVDLRPITGQISRPVLSVHTTGDYTVPITIAQDYRRAVERAGRGEFLVQRAIRNAGHCTFSVAEQAQAFDDLVRWAAGGPRPGGDDLLGDLTDIGRAFTTPLRPGDPGHAPDPAPPAPAPPPPAPAPAPAAAP